MTRFPFASSRDGAEHLLERVGLVRVVDDDVERLAGVDRLEPPRHAAHRLEAAPDRVVVTAERARRERGAERVLDVEAAAELEIDARERRRVGRVERDRVRQLRREPPPVRVAGVDDRERPRFREEEPPLRLEVRLHVAVEVEVILAEVREDENAKADAIEPVEDRGVRRRLHRARAVAGVEHLAERPLQVDRLGRRPHDAAPLAADARLDRPEQARSPPGRGEDREQTGTSSSSCRSCP